jgi:hypothetical protein
MGQRKVGAIAAAIQESSLTAARDFAHCPGGVRNV